jgi:UDP-N-acetylmuramate--alanine ligase
MNLNEIHRVYFIGIGGIGMSALARYFSRLGKVVSGYDKTPTPLTDELYNEGISSHFVDDISNIPKVFLEIQNTLVVITPAIPTNHKEWIFFQSEGYLIKKRSEVLGVITKETYCFAVAGTHGKTTTSAILGHILHQSGVEVTALLGGIVNNYNSNIIGDGTKVTVVEADEFDRSFHHLYPNKACVTSVDADHLDVYGTKDAFEDSFREFALRVPTEDLFVPSNVPLNGNRLEIGKQSTYYIPEVSIENGAYVFNVITPRQVLKNLKMQLPGRHNLMNTLTAVSMAESYGVSEENIRNALGSFEGIQRRFSFQINTDELVYIDDYAHHPTEINAVYHAVKELYPNRKILVIFQPHLFSRTRDFVDGFAESLSQFDEIALMEIYPARELPIPGVDALWLLNKIENQEKKLVDEDNLLTTVLDSEARVILTLGAGDISNWVEPIKKKLYEKVL